jgi:anti-sigma factor RsiW
MGRIISFNPDRHEQTQTLLPWYVTGQLEAEEAALVEGHLRDCRDCRAEFRLEQRLEASVAGLPFDTDLGWAEVRARLAAQDDRRGLAAAVSRALSPAGRVGWTIAAQFVLVIAAIGMLLPLSQPARYHALGAARTAPPGDVIVMFRPQAQAQDLSRALRDSGARLVDGPTAADAYVLAAPPGGRSATLARLRANDDIVMAEPIDAASRP